MTEHTMTTPALLAQLGRMTAETWQPYYDRPTAINGFVVTFTAPYVARVKDCLRTAVVNDYDCSICGYHNDEGCRHLDAMLEAYQKLRHDIMHPAMPDVDARREAYYHAGLIPVKPLC